MDSSCEEVSNDSSNPPQMIFSVPKEDHSPLSSDSDPPSHFSVSHHDHHHEYHTLNCHPDSPVLALDPGVIQYGSNTSIASSTPSKRSSSSSSSRLVSNPFHFEAHPPTHNISTPTTTFVPKLTCFTCNGIRTNFYCYGCIQRGEFSSTQQKTLLRDKFCEKKMQLIRLEARRNQLMDRVQALMQRRVQVDHMKERVMTTKIRVNQLKEDLARKEGQLKESKAKQIDIKLVQSEADKMITRNQEKNRFTRDYIKKHEDKVAQKKVVIRDKLNKVRELTWNLAVNLRTSIFLLEEYEVEDTGENPILESMPLLGYLQMSATTNSHFKPRTGSLSNQVPKFTVVEPWLPQTLDITVYTEWVRRHRDENGLASSYESIDKRNDAFRISAALSYVTHMVDVLAGVLDVRLPRRISFSEFYTKTVGGSDEYLTHEELMHKVAKLNTNIALLCLSQRVDPNMIHPRQGVKNLINLLNPSLESDLGRRGYLPLDPDFLHHLESELGADLRLIQEPLMQELPTDTQFDFDDMGFESIPNWVVTNNQHFTYDTSFTSQVSSYTGGIAPNLNFLSRFFARE